MEIKKERNYFKFVILIILKEVYTKYKWLK